LAVYDDRDYYFRLRRGVTGNMSGEFMHVWHYLRFALGYGGAAYALAYLYTYTGWQPLKWAKYQLAVFHDVEAYPVNAVHIAVYNGRYVG